jgi:hypothetical protein
VWDVTAQNCTFLDLSSMSVYIYIYIYIYIYGLKIRRKDDSIKMDLTEIGLGWDVDWIDVTQDSSRWRDVVSIVINFRVPQNASNFLNI